MEYRQAKIENGKIKTLSIVHVNQSEMTSDCWLIQFRGLDACTTCEFKRTADCGGKAILKKIKAGAYPKEGIGKRTL